MLPGAPQAAPDLEHATFSSQCCARRAAAPGLCCEAVLAEEPDEVRAADQPLPLEHTVPLLEEDHLVGAAGADRLDEAAALDQLLGEGRRHGRERRRDEDRVVWRPLRKPTSAVARDDVRTLDAKPLEIRAPDPSDVVPALDAPDLAGEAGEKRRLPAVAGPDLEHAVGA